MNYNFVSVLRSSIIFNRVYRLCRCARIPIKSIFNVRLGINTEVAKSESSIRPEPSPAEAGDNFAFGKITFQCGLRPENREIFSNLV